ncbi:MAG TPA: hypothetical protein PK893_13240 [Candidatus Competibacteraceae bacterium]|mgnify:CR=1 FL=1|nr:hypothetical protein [Candidatus Competibacteraceae bacterium]
MLLNKMTIGRFIIWFVVALAVLLLGGRAAWAAEPVPVLTNGLPADAFPGSKVCFPVNWNNTNEPGYGPYIRLILPPELTFDSAKFLGIDVTVQDIGTFPSAPGNTLTDPITNTSVTGPEGYSLRLLILPVGSVVTGGPTLSTEVCATLSDSAEIGVPLDVTAQPVYRYGDTATGANGPIEGTADTKPLTGVVA